MEIKRSELNNLIITEATSSKILSVSTELDNLINDFLALNNNKHSN